MSVETPSGVRPLWVNLGGAEAGGNLFRWNWDGTPGCSTSPAGIVNPVGVQTNLTDGSDGRTHVQNAAAAWSGLPGTSVQFAYSAAGGNVDVFLDAETSSAWSGPMDCGLGVVGVGGTGTSYGSCSFKGDPGYHSPQAGNAWLRRSTCAGGYPAAIFRCAVLHEVGHTLGLGHPDSKTSAHSTTTPADWDAAVMRSAIPSPYPDAPQKDDAAAVEYYYGAPDTGGPVASFTFAPSSPTAGQPVQFTDTSTGAPSDWLWEFGDDTYSDQRNPTKTWSVAGTWTVRLTVSGDLGFDSTTRVVTVGGSANRPPVAVADAWATGTGAPLTVPAPGVLANDSDPDGDALTAVLVSGPARGTLVLQPSGAFAYTPPAGFTGTTTFAYRASDGRGASSASAVVAITVAAVETERVVPILLDGYGVGTSRYRSELVLTNRGTTAASVELTYTAATALRAVGSGTVSEPLGPGRQLVLDDALAYLRGRGLAIPQAFPGASQGGTLRARFRGLSSPDAGAAIGRTTALLAEGRAGVAYPGLAPSEWAEASAQRVFGLRETAAERSNLAMANLDAEGDVSLTVTLYSGSRSDRRSYVLPETIQLGPLQWTQLNSVLARAGFANGWAVVERVAGSAPFYAYGVFNDAGTNDGSFIDPVPATAGEAARTVPVVLELGIYSTELILANPTETDLDVTLRYVESSLPGSLGVARRAGVDFLRAREQKTVEAIPHLRALGVDVGPAGASYAGSLTASFSAAGEPAPGFAAARAKSPGGAGGTYGVYYSGLGAGQTATSEAWVFGLKEDGEARSNLAVAHAGPADAPLTLQAEVFDGETGESVGKTGTVTLAPGQWSQWTWLLRAFGVRQGYARVVRVSGSSPFLAYGVVNDGGTSRPGTNDGSYVPMLSRR
jgi:PKD repeat protein